MTVREKALIEKVGVLLEEIGKKTTPDRQGNDLYSFILDARDALFSARNENPELANKDVVNSLRRIKSL